MGSPKSSQQSSISGLTRQNCSGTLRTLPPAPGRDPTGELVAALDEHRAERAADQPQDVCLAHRAVAKQRPQEP